MRYIAPINEQREQNKENTGTRQSSQSMQRTTKKIKNEATNKRNTTVMNKNIDAIIL